MFVIYSPLEIRPVCVIIERESGRKPGMPAWGRGRGMRMDQGGKGLFRWRASRWNRRFLTAVATALSAELFFNLWVDNFRISAAVVLFPVLLVTLMQDSRRPGTGALTALTVLAVRCLLGLLGGQGLVQVAAAEYPGAVFYLCYDGLLCLQLPDRGQAGAAALGRAFFLCDLLSNLVNLTLSKGAIPDLWALAELAGIALIRSVLAVAVLWLMKRYRRLLLAEEHERRYQRLFLMTANLKNELYFLKKDAENIEGIMTRAYRLYERLGAQDDPEELRQLALSIARDVHEVKKDNLSIIRGIEGEVAGTGTDNDERMRLSDLFRILQDTMGHILREKGSDIALECWCGADFATEEHYRLMSIVKNLVMNAAEAIQSGTGMGVIQVEEWVEEGRLALVVRDNGPGIQPRAMQHLFQVGYSTKFDPETGNINRGIGLPAVKFLVEELGGDIQVESDPERAPGAAFRVTIPMDALTKGEP